MSQYNILVVDDDREIVRSLGKLLELEGYRVKKAYNGMEAQRSENKPGCKEI